MFERQCAKCKKDLKTRSQKLYCSNKCQADYQYDLYIDSWKKGIKDGNRGIFAKNISGHLKRFLLEKNGEKCWVCGWSKKNLFTKHVPVEIDHVDGNFENNSERNLRLICPNCHSLTRNFKNLNKGKGRRWRMKKYLKQT